MGFPMRKLAAACLTSLLIETPAPHAGVSIEPDGPAFVVNDFRYGNQAWPDVAVVGPHEALVTWM
jgi:hypothetical protein